MSQDQTQSQIPAEIPAEPAHPSNWAPHPPKKMIMSPMILTIGGLLAFFTVVFMVVILPTTTFEPPVSDNYRELTPLEEEGRDIYLANGCLYCHSGFTRPQDVFAGQYYVYPRVSEPGDFSASGSGPNLFGSNRTGPDLSQAGGFHPDDWHYAHYYNPRYTTPLSIMPQFNFLSESQAEALIAFTQSQGGKLADARSQHQEVMKIFNLAMFTLDGEEESVPGAPAFSDIGNLVVIDRGLWFDDNPLEVNQQNIVRGRQIFEERCIACHGTEGDGLGPGEPFLSPGPPGFTGASGQQSGNQTSPGTYFWRIQRGFPGSAMENFGTRLSVEDMWRLVLFIKTIPNGGLTADLPTTDMYLEWAGTSEMFTWAECFYPEQDVSQITAQAPDEGIGDMPGMVASGTLNPYYAVYLWMINNNARPCVDSGFETVTFVDIVNEASQRTDGYAVQGVDQTQFIPDLNSLVSPDQLPPALLEKVWD